MLGGDVSCFRYFTNHVRRVPKKPVDLKRILLLNSGNKHKEPVNPVRVTHSLGGKLLKPENTYRTDGLRRLSMSG